MGFFHTLIHFKKCNRMQQRYAAMQANRIKFLLRCSICLLMGSTIEMIPLKYLGLLFVLESKLFNFSQPVMPV